MTADHVPAGPVEDFARFDMLYCDAARCRVNTFERGRPADEGRCPGCSLIGIPVPTRR